MLEFVEGFDTEQAAYSSGMVQQHGAAATSLPVTQEFLLAKKPVPMTMAMAVPASPATQPRGDKKQGKGMKRSSESFPEEESFKSSKKKEKKNKKARTEFLSQGLLKDDDKRAEATSVDKNESGNEEAGSDDDDDVLGAMETLENEKNDKSSGDDEDEEAGSDSDDDTLVKKRARGYQKLYRRKCDEVDKLQEALDKLQGQLQEAAAEAASARKAHATAQKHLITLVGDLKRVDSRGGMVATTVQEFRERNMVYKNFQGFVPSTYASMVLGASDTDVRHKQQMGGAERSSGSKVVPVQYMNGMYRPPKGYGSGRSGGAAARSGEGIVVSLHHH